MHLAQPGDVIDAWSNTTDDQQMAVVVRTQQLEVIRMYVRSGTHVPTHEAHWEMTVLCIQGRIAIAAAERRHELYAGQLLYLLLNEAFTIYGVENSSVLVTIVRPMDGQPLPLIGERTRSD